MSIPQSQKQWLVQGKDKGIDGLVKQDNVPIPEVGENEVLVRLRGASLNYRDLIIPRACISVPLNAEAQDQHSTGNVPLPPGPPRRPRLGRRRRGCRRRVQGHPLEEGKPSHHPLQPGPSVRPHDRGREQVRPGRCPRRHPPPVRHVQRERPRQDARQPLRH